MEESPALQHNGPWAVAVNALRMGYIGMALVFSGLILMAFGSTQWVMAVGMMIWLSAAAVTCVAFFWARHELPEPRPELWSMRVKLIHDTVHFR
jgi:hypothetical protein